MKSKTVSDAFPGFLEAGDLDGKSITLVIKSIRDANQKDKGKDGRVIDKPIIEFVGAKKSWVLNKTNAKIIRELYGNAFEDWTDKKIIIYPTVCDAFGKKNTPCVRVKKIYPDTGKPPELKIVDPFA